MDKNLVVKINQSDLITKKISDIDLITRIEAVLYLKGRPISKKDLSEITSSDINSINDAIKELKSKYSNSKSALELNEINNTYCLELKSNLNNFVSILGYKFWDETQNDTYKLFLGASD